MTSNTPNPNPSQRVAEEIWAELGRRRMSCAALARKLNRSPYGVSRRMTGKAPFTVDEVHEIAEVLEVPAERLLSAS